MCRSTTRLPGRRWRAWRATPQAVQIQPAVLVHPVPHVLRPELPELLEPDLVGQPPCADGPGEASRLIRRAATPGGGCTGNSLDDDDAGRSMLGRSKASGSNNPACTVRLRAKLARKTRAWLALAAAAGRNRVSGYRAPPMAVPAHCALTLRYVAGRTCCVTPSQPMVAAECRFPWAPTHTARESPSLGHAA